MKWIDLHAHAGPSVMPRAVDAAQMLLEAGQAGYAAVVIKDHYFPTMMSAKIAEDHLDSKGCRAFGGIALNNSVGGINLKAVDAACALGAKFVWMPTVSSLRHKIMHSGHGLAFPGSKGMSVAEEPIMYLDDNGELKPEVIAVLDYLAGKPEVIHRPRQPRRNRQAGPCRSHPGRTAYHDQPPPLYDRRLAGGYGGLEPSGCLYRAQRRGFCAGFQVLLQ